MKTTHVCSKCGVEKPAAKFQLYKGQPNGQCRDCKTKAMRIKREQSGMAVRKKSTISENKKLCMGCTQFKDLDCFSSSKRGLGGLAAYCKPCHAERYRSKDKAKKATATYRERHKERYLTNHRVRMFEYRTKKKVTSDGSVTDQFLKEMYSQTRCFYCGNETPVENRTIDHRIPLAKEGKHIASNLVMACGSCNSSKRDLSEEDFINKFINKE